MRRLAVAVAALGLVAPASALAASGHRSHHAEGSKGGRHGLALRGKLASIDGKTRVAVLSVRGAKRTLLALDLSHASVRLTGRQGGDRAGTLRAVRTQDRVAITLKVSMKVALADGAKGIPAPVAQLVDERPSSTPPEPQAKNPTVSGVVTSVSGNDVSITLGNGPDARTMTLDLGAAQVYAGHPPVLADAGSIAAGDHVLANLAVAYDTVKADLQTGTPVPVANLYDIGAPPPDTGPSGGDNPEPVILGGTITALADGRATISFGDGDNAHTAILDLSSATIYAGAHVATATVTSADALHVGDRVYAVLSVSRDTASADVQAGTPLPVTKLYDAGGLTQPTPPAPPTPPSPPAPPTPPTPPTTQPVIIGGTIAAIGPGQVTISFGDPGATHTGTLDLSAATIYSGAHIATATVTTADALHVGDRVYAVLSVSRDTASADMQAGTPVPVSKLYDAGQ